jgi:N utilization substance protein A
VVRELKGEKIDVIEWVDDPAQFIAHALSPAKVKEVKVNEKEKEAEIIVPDDQLSLAIGKEGQNARLAAKLTGWRIDIKSESEALEERKEEKAAKKERANCEALTASGKKCRNKAVEGERFCSIHLSKVKS